MAACSFRFKDGGFFEFYFFMERLLGQTISWNNLPIHLATQNRHHPAHFRMIRLMSETYQSKRERWQRMLEALPVSLRERVSLRNVEAVTTLTAQAQERLAEAIQSGLKRLPRAVEQLKLDPNTSLPDLLNPAPQAIVEGPSAIPVQIQKELTDLIQLCFADMPRISARALAGAEVMNIVLQTVQAHHNLFESNHLRTDFVMVVLYALLRQTVERLEEIIEDTPACRQAIIQSGLPWKCRHGDAQQKRLEKTKCLNELPRPA